MAKRKHSGEVTLQMVIDGDASETEYVYQDADPRRQDSRKAALEAARLRLYREEGRILGVNGLGGLAGLGAAMRKFWGG